MEKIKIAVSPSDQRKNIYNGQDTNEMAQMRKVGERLVESLIRCGFEVVYLPEGLLKNRVAKANAENVDAYLALHTNAYDTTVRGIRTHHFPSREGKKLASAINNQLAMIYTGTTRAFLVESTTLYELKWPVAPACLPEIGFHDNAIDAEWIVNNTDNIAEALCKGVCDYFRVPYVSHETILYCVQVGAFSVRENAENMLKTVKIDYPNAFIKEVKKA